MFRFPSSYKDDKLQIINDRDPELAFLLNLSIAEHQKFIHKQFEGYAKSQPTWFLGVRFNANELNNLRLAGIITSLLSIQYALATTNMQGECWLSYNARFPEGAAAATLQYNSGINPCLDSKISLYDNCMALKQISNDPKQAALIPSLFYLALYTSLIMCLLKNRIDSQFDLRSIHLPRIIDWPDFKIDNSSVLWKTPRTCFYYLLVFLCHLSAMIGFARDPAPNASELGGYADGFVNEYWTLCDKNFDSDLCTIDGSNVKPNFAKIQEVSPFLNYPLAFRLCLIASFGFLAILFSFGFKRHYGSFWEKYFHKKEAQTQTTQSNVLALNNSKRPIDSFIIELADRHDPELILDLDNNMSTLAAEVMSRALQKSAKVGAFYEAAFRIYYQGEVWKRRRDAVLNWDPTQIFPPSNSLPSDAITVPVRPEVRTAAATGLAFGSTNNQVPISDERTALLSAAHNPYNS